MDVRGKALGAPLVPLDDVRDSVNAKTEQDVRVGEIGQAGGVGDLVGAQRRHCLCVMRHAQTPSLHLAREPYVSATAPTDVVLEYRSVYRSGLSHRPEP